MKTRSAKNKGKRLQNLVRDRILAIFPTLDPSDVKSTTMGESGVDIQLSKHAKESFPFAVECKNQEKISIWACIEQAKKNAQKERSMPLLVIGRNNKIPQAVIELDDLLFLVELAHLGAQGFDSEGKEKWDSRMKTL